MATIDIDLSWMRIGKVGGAEQATYELIRGLSFMDRSQYYNLHVPRSTYYEWQLDSRFRHRAFFSDRIETERRNLQKQPIQPSVSDLFHAPSGYLPTTWRARKLVVTIHDLQHLSFPQYFSFEERSYREQQLKEIIERADHLIAISSFTKEEIIHYYGVDEDKVSVVWMSPDPLFAREHSVSASRRLCRKMGITKPFLLYPAYPWAHKNHTGLLQAWDFFDSGQNSGKYQLILTGKPLDKAHPAYTALRRSVATGGVVHLGFRSPYEIRCLYHAARALIFPSEFEGFGMPVVESFLAGLPVAASSVASLPEIAGDAALLFDQTNTESIAVAIDRVLNDAPLRTYLIARGFEKAAQFHPLRTTEGTIAVYKKVLGENDYRGRIRTSVVNAATKLPSSKRFELFRHYARLSERSAREQHWFQMLFASFIATCLAPIYSIKRLVGGAYCHLEVFVRRALRR
jgi:glycosyltransferase involved in cell wall biosynthesis